MKGSAVFSPCQRYRYRLDRRWDSLFSDRKGPCVFVGCNPSTATDVDDDPTIRRCIDFARRWGHDHYIMVNLFALRSTDPGALLVARDPIGPENDRHLREAFREAHIVVAAWGVASPLCAARAQAVLTFLSGKPLCLGHTASGAPRHPLYIRADTKPVLFSGWPS